MNYTNIEVSAQLHRERLMEQMKEIRLEQQALKGRANLSDLFGQSMYRLSSWMMRAGDALNMRYEKFCLDCPPPSTNTNFAQSQL